MCESRAIALRFQGQQKRNWPSHSLASRTFLVAIIQYSTLDECHCMGGGEFLFLIMDRNSEVERLHIVARMGFLVRAFGGAADVRGKTE
jgi:hypothetical protein